MLSGVQTAMIRIYSLQKHYFRKEFSSRHLSPSTKVDPVVKTESCRV